MISQRGRGGKCSRPGMVRGIWESLVSTFSSEGAEEWKDILKDAKIVAKYQRTNMDNYRLLKTGIKSKKQKIKLRIPPTLQLRWDWHEKKKKDLVPWISSKLIYLYRCTVKDVDGKPHNMTFAFNLIELQRQILVASCMASMINDKNLAGFSINVYNPVTQDPLNDVEIKDITKAFIDITKEYTKWALGKDIIKYSGLAALALSFIPSAVATLPSIGLVMWGAPVLTGLISVGEMLENKSVTEVKDNLLSLEGVYAVGKYLKAQDVETLELGGLHPVFRLVLGMGINLGVDEYNNYVRRKSGEKTGEFDLKIAETIRDIENIRKKLLPRDIKDVRKSDALCQIVKNNANALKLSMTGGSLYYKYMKYKTKYLRLKKLL